MERLRTESSPEKKETSRHLVIGLHGAIGSGKTELASLLHRELGLVHFQEKFKTNPYLEDFYRNPYSFSFLMESHFLEDKVMQMRSIGGTVKNEGVVVDPTLWQDAEIYAFVHRELGWMTEQQYQYYLTSYRGLTKLYDIQDPDLVISVQAPWETIRERIQKRARPYELLMLKRYPEYFHKIAQRTEEWAGENRARVPIVVVDSGSHNYVVNPATRAMIVNKIRLEATRIFDNDPRITIPPKLKYIWPNFDPSVVNRSTHLRR